MWRNGGGSRRGRSVDTDLIASLLKEYVPEDDPRLQAAQAVLSQTLLGRMYTPTPPIPSTESRCFLSVPSYVTFCGGRRVIEKVLIANNGIAAVKAIRSIRRWAYETFSNERAIHFVVMATPEDMHINAEFIRLADEVVEVPGGSNNNNYANVDLIVEIAERCGAQGVWAGWGHASEDPRLPECLAASPHGIAFLGPGAGAMHDLGDKIASSILAQTADLPVVSWTGSGLVVDYESEGVPSRVYHKAVVTNQADTVVAAHKIGYPCMLKASEGGGGKGIRKVHCDDDVAPALRQVMAEVPGSPIFLMKVVSKPRHLEVQILADQYGNAISIFGRDCSIQRRHQKIIEEGPVVAAPLETWMEMERGAVRLAKMVRYFGAGTVEYLYTPDGRYFFLELNPRLQVEHPVTEWISDINLPAAQLNIAMGIPLHRIADVRRFYGEDPHDSTPIDFETAASNPPTCHVISVRLTAENPDLGFQPTSGAIQELSFRSTPHVWGYFSVGSHGGVHEFSDSQIGHLFAKGASREEARQNMVLALKEVSIRGEIRTTTEYLVRILEFPEYKENKINTTWLDRLITQRLTADRPDPFTAIVCGALHVAHATVLEHLHQFNSALDKGRMPRSDVFQSEFPVELIYQDTKYKLTVTKTGWITYTIILNGSHCNAEMRPLSEGDLLISFDGRSFTTNAIREPGALRLVVDGRTCIFTKEVDPSVLRSHMPGKLVRHLVEDGSHIAENTAYAEVEVMKMYLTLTSPAAGVITFVRGEGSVLNSGDVVAHLQLDDPSQVKKAKPYTGRFPSFKASVVWSRPHRIQRAAILTLRMALHGYVQPDTLFSRSLDDAVNALRGTLLDPELPFFEYEETMSAIKARLPSDLQKDLGALVRSPRSPSPHPPPSHLEEFPAAAISHAVQECRGSLHQAAHFDELTRGLLDVVSSFKCGSASRRATIVGSLLQEYIDGEKYFLGNVPDDVLLGRLRELNEKEENRAYEIAFSHHQLAKKNAVVARLLELVNEEVLDVLRPKLQEIASMNDRDYGFVAMRARHLLIQESLPSFAGRWTATEQFILEALSKPEEEQRKDIMQLVDASEFMFDILVMLFRHTDARVRMCAMEIYLRRAYRCYGIEDVQVVSSPEKLVGEWKFTLGREHADVLTGADSLDDPPLSTTLETDGPLHHGVMLVATHREETLCRMVDEALGRNTSESFPNVVSIVVQVDGNGPLEQSNPEVVVTFQKALFQRASVLREKGVHRVTLVCLRDDLPSYYTFIKSANYEEDTNLRHIEPALAYQLEIRRLANFDVQSIPTISRQIHVYYAQEKGCASGTATSRIKDRRLFARAVLRRGDIVPNFAPISSVDDQRAVAQRSEGERILIETINELEVATRNPRFGPTNNNHIFLDLMAEINVDVKDMQEIVIGFYHRYVNQLWRLRVCEVELKIHVRSSPLVPSQTYRLVAWNPSNFVLEVDVYQEVKNEVSGRAVFKSLGSVQGDLRRSRLVLGPRDGNDVLSPYPVLDALERRRLVARANDTTFVYDFPIVFTAALESEWDAFMRKHPKAKRPTNVIDYTELILGGDIESHRFPFKGATLKEVQRPPGTNAIGMVAWRWILRTPQTPEGRPLIVISNDITHQNGTFGECEDLLFRLASELARQEGIPRLYLAANSGARIGLAQEVKDAFEVAWCDNEDPLRGFQYLFLSGENSVRLAAAGSVQGIHVPDTDDRASHLRITGIIGTENGLGVENLRGSGMIAGETSLAYEEIVTLTYVAGRSVGIGAYLVRLGQRVIQKEGSEEAPILLTGSSALNRLLGREVYTSNSQIGGVSIMAPNGVTHVVVKSDYKGALMALRWLSYVPAKRGDLPTPAFSVDAVEREVEWYPPVMETYDPRELISGYENPDGTWISGFFDRDSFMETLSGWARTVVVGRARLGGIPCGVIAVETRTVDLRIPADPAMPESMETIEKQAGQVWYRDSAYKTASTIRDLNLEGIPLIMFANWRGFSGGMKEMYNEVVKFGSYIVDALRSYRQPVFVYIPPRGELRGGAWVVLDPLINRNGMMEMFADVDCRGGVLEPSGTIEIKYRYGEILKTMHRLDVTLREMDSRMSTAQEKEKQELRRQIEAREKELYPIYQQIALSLADAQDTPGRMKAKQSISHIVPWAESRHFFFWHLRRRLAELSLEREMCVANPSLERSVVHEEARRIVQENKNIEREPADHVEQIREDRFVVEMLEGNPSWKVDVLRSLRQQYIATTLESVGVSKVQREELLGECLKFLQKGEA